MGHPLKKTFVFLLVLWTFLGCLMPIHAEDGPWSQVTFYVR